MQDVHALGLAPLSVPVVSYRDVVWPVYEHPPCKDTTTTFLKGGVPYWNMGCPAWEQVLGVPSSGCVVVVRRADASYTKSGRPSRPGVVVARRADASSLCVVVVRRADASVHQARYTKPSHEDPRPFPPASPAYHISASPHRVHPRGKTHSLIANVLAHALAQRGAELDCGSALTSTAAAITKQPLVATLALRTTSTYDEAGTLCSEPLTSLLAADGDVKSFPCHGTMYHADARGDGGSQGRPLWCCRNGKGANHSAIAAVASDSDGISDDWCFGEESAADRNKPGWFYHGTASASAVFTLRAPPPSRTEGMANGDGTDVQLDVGYMQMRGCVGTVRLRVTRRDNGVTHGSANASSAPCEWLVDAHTDSDASMYRSVSFRVPSACFHPPSDAASHEAWRWAQDDWTLDVTVDAVPGSDRVVQGCTGLKNRFKLTHLVTCIALES